MLNRVLIAVPLLASCIASSPRVTYKEQESTTRVSLRGVSAVSPLVCWASGAEGTFLRTIDGGRTWARGVVPGANHLDFRDVESVDANSAFLMSAGRPAEIWRTQDGGSSWERCAQLDQEGVFLDSVALHGNKGLAWGDPLDGHFLTLASSDAGLSWTRIGSQLPQPLPGEAGFAASGTCIFLSGKDAWIGTGGGSARVLTSHDHGRSWNAAATPIQRGSPSKGIFSVVFVDEKRGAIVGGDYSRPALEHGTAAYTIDGGTTWTLSADQPGYRSCVALVPLDQPSWLISISKSGASISEDCGATWNGLSLPGHYALDFSPETWLDGRAVGWAVGREGAIVRVEAWQ